MENLAGRIFERLTVLSYAGEQKWSCICECGNQVFARRSNLLLKKSTSCGCKRRETTKRQLTTHGGRYSSEYKTWLAMKQRCLNPKNPDYSYYGGRGITVCDDWKNSFERFVSDVGPRPSLSYSIDRVDNNGNYEPGNCRWATRTEQNNNTRRNIKRQPDSVDVLREVLKS